MLRNEGTEWLEDIDTKIYPKDIQTLKDDEIILSLDYVTLRDLCFELQIDRNVNSLSNYLLSNTLDVYFDLANYSWDYTDEQLLIVKGFTLENSLKIYHSNHLWNEHMFEEMMRFPSNDALSLKDNEPWIMKKIYYLKAKENRDKLLNLFLDSKEMDKYIFEIADEMFYPWLYYDRKIEERNRIHVFTNTVAHIPSWHVDYFMNNDSNLTSPIYGNNSGFLIYQESLMMDF